MSERAAWRRDIEAVVSAITAGQRVNWEAMDGPAPPPAPAGRTAESEVTGHDVRAAYWAPDVPSDDVANYPGWQSVAEWVNDRLRKAREEERAKPCHMYGGTWTRCSRCNRCTCSCPSCDTEPTAIAAAVAKVNAEWAAGFPTTWWLTVPTTPGEMGEWVTAIKSWEDTNAKNRAALLKERDEAVRKARVEARLNGIRWAIRPETSIQECAVEIRRLEREQAAVSTWSKMSAPNMTAAPAESQRPAVVETPQELVDRVVAENMPKATTKRVLEPVPADGAPERIGVRWDRKAGMWVQEFIGRIDSVEYVRAALLAAAETKLTEAERERDVFKTALEAYDRAEKAESMLSDVRAQFDRVAKDIETRIAAALDTVQHPGHVPVGAQGSVMRRAWELGRDYHTVTLAHLEQKQRAETAETDLAKVRVERDAARADLAEVRSHLAGVEALERLNEDAAAKRIADLESRAVVLPNLDGPSIRNWVETKESQGWPTARNLARWYLERLPGVRDAAAK